MPIKRFRVNLLIFCLAVPLIIAATTKGAGAETIIVTEPSGDVGGPGCTLRDAIMAANLDAATGSCTGGEGSDTIVLPADQTITLSQVDNTTRGENGLPAIVSDITIEGNGSIVQRLAAEDAAAFRIFYVAADGRLTLDNLTLRLGRAGRQPGMVVEALSRRAALAPMLPAT